MLERKTLDSTFGVARVCYTKKKPLGNSEKMAGAVRPLVLPLPEVEAETMGWTKRNNPRPLRAAVTRANVKGILVCGNIGRRGSSGWRRPPHSGAGSGTSPRDSRLHVHLISPCTHKMCSDCVCSPSLRFRYSTHGDSSCCLRAAPRRPRQARRFARARAPASRSARVGGSRRRTQAGCRALWCFSFSSVAGRRPCLAPSLWSSLRAGRALASAHRDRRCARDARGTRASRVVLAAAVEHGRRACGDLFSSLLLSFRRSALGAPSIHPHAGGGRAHHERARGARDARRDARGAWGVRAQSALGARGPCFARVWCSSPPLFSRSVAPRAALPRSTHTPAGARASRAGARRMQRATRRARRVGVRAPRALGVRGPCARGTAVLLGFSLLHARYCSLHSAPRDRRRAGRAHHERTRDARGARCGARGVRGRQGKSAFLCRGSRFARVLCLSLLSLLRAALLPRSPPRKRACASGHTTHARSESRVGAALRVCLWFICASFRDLARRAARSCALVCVAAQNTKIVFYSASASPPGRPGRSLAI